MNIELNEHSSEVKDILNRYHINDTFWHFSPKYYDAYIRKICGDYLYESSAAFKNSKFSWVKNFFLHSCFIILGALVSLMKSFGMSKPHGKINEDARILACPFCWRYVWFKRLPHMIKESIRIVYHPLFHYDYYKKNVEAYDRKVVIPEFYQFTFRDIFYSLFLIIRYYRRLSRCAKELDDIYGIYTGKFSRIFIFPILYGGFVRRFIEDHIKSNDGLVWLFDYDYDYKYIIFNNLIHELRKNDVTVHIQHGSFVTYNPAYCNPVCDYSLCCSHREKEVIDHFNAFDSKIEILGAPLQTFDDVPKDDKSEKQWDVLLLLAATDGIELEPMKKVLQFFHNSTYKCKVRFRPASKSTDRLKLCSYLNGMDESEGTTLYEDVSMSKIVVCFSDDALYTAIRNNNPIIYLRNIDIRKNYEMTGRSAFFYIINDSELSSVPVSELILRYRECNYDSDSFVLNNFGYFNINEISNRLNSLLSKLL